MKFKISKLIVFHASASLIMIVGSYLTLSAPTEKNLYIRKQINQLNKRIKYQEKINSEKNIYRNKLFQSNKIIQYHIKESIKQNLETRERQTIVTLLNHHLTLRKNTLINKKFIAKFIIQATGRYDNIMSFIFDVTSKPPFLWLKKISLKQLQGTPFLILNILLEVQHE